MYNQCVLIGRVGKDAATSQSKTGKTVARFSLATDYGYGDKRQTTWHNIEAYDKTADICTRYAKKGATVTIVGRIRNSTNEKNGERVNYSAVVCESIITMEKSTESKPKPNAVDEAEIPFSL